MCEDDRQARIPLCPDRHGTALLFYLHCMCWWRCSTGLSLIAQALFRWVKRWNRNNCAERTLPALDAAPQVSGRKKKNISLWVFLLFSTLLTKPSLLRTAGQSWDKFFSLGPKSDLVTALTPNGAALSGCTPYLFPSSTLTELKSSPGVETRPHRKGRSNTQKGTASLSPEDVSMPRECLSLLAGQAGKKLWA